MPAAIIDDTELVEALARAGVEGVSNEDQTEAIDIATDRIRQAALNWYTSDSFELLTADTTPPEMRGHALSLAMHEVTRHDAGRPASIDARMTDATKWLSFLAGGSTHYDQAAGAVLVALDDATTVSSRSLDHFDRLTGEETKRVFDRANRFYRRRNRSI